GPGAHVRGIAPALSTGRQASKVPDRGGKPRKIFGSGGDPETAPGGSGVDHRPVPFPIAANCRSPFGPPDHRANEAGGTKPPLRPVSKGKGAGAGGVEG